MSSSEYQIILTSSYRRFFTGSPVDGYVKFLGAASGDSLIVRDVVESKPSTVDLKTARVLAARAKINVAATGSRLAPPVDIYVVFYNQNKADRVALIFAVPGEGFGHIQQTAGNFYIDIVEYHVGSQSNDSKKPAPAANPAH